MRARLFVIITFSLMLPIGAVAQTSSGHDEITAPVQKQSTAAQTTTATTTTNVGVSDEKNEWLASGFAGSNFGNNAESASTAFGGSIGYLWRSRWGAEFDAGFTPNFDLQSNFFGLGITPMVNSYMFNAVAVRPFGPDEKWQPFISGGVGAISLRSGMSSDAVTTLGNPDATRFGGDIGGGLMGFVGNWGFKADIEYLRAAGSYQTSASQFSTTGGTTTATTTSGSTTPVTGTGTNPSPAPSGPYVSKDTGGTTSAPSGLADTVLSGLHFWRANVGVALRW